MLAMFTGEVVVHTWDLAKATDQEPVWDQSVLEVAFEKLRAGLPGEGRAAMFEQIRANTPEERRTPTDPFAEVVPVAADAPLIDQIVAWTGRRP